MKTTIPPLYLRLAVTAGIVSAAAILAFLFWQDYWLYPWTRAGQVNSDIVRIAPQVSGPIDRLLVEDNQWVKKGDLLFTIRDEPYVQAVNVAKAQLAEAASIEKQARYELSIHKKLPSHLISKELVQQYQSKQGIAIASYNAAKTRLDLAKINLDYTQVTAPVDGYVTNLLVEAGDYVSVGEAIIALIDTASFWVTGYFKETQIRYIQVGDRATVKLMAYPDHKLNGVVQGIARGIAASGSTVNHNNLLESVKPTFDWIRLAQRIPVRINFDPMPQDIVISRGMTATIIIDIDKRH